MKKIKAKTDRILPQWAPFSLYLGVDEKVLPSELKENIFLLTDYNKIGGTGLLYISVSPSGDDTRAPTGRRAVTVTCFIPRKEWNKSAQDESVKQNYTKAILKSLSTLITFIDEGIDVCEAAAPLDYEKYTLRPNGIVTGLAATNSSLGFKGLSNHTNYKNLFLIGDTCFPGFGANFVSISALNLSRIIGGN